MTNCYKKIFFRNLNSFLIFYIKKGNNIAVDPHPEKREDVMSTIVETSRLL